MFLLSMAPYRGLIVHSRSRGFFQTFPVYVIHASKTKRQ